MLNTVIIQSGQTANDSNDMYKVYACYLESKFIIGVPITHRPIERSFNLIASGVQMFRTNSFKLNVTKFNK